MKTRYSVLMVFFLCGLSVMAAGAGEQATDAYELGEVVVTGEKATVENVTIADTLTAEDIRATNSRTVAEALSFAPGVVMTRGRKNEPEISVHGFSQEKTLFLIDGIPYYETYNGKLNLDQIPSEIISKIEITKNAPSVLYGPNAQIAVVNVITKKGTPEPSFTFQGDMSSNDTYGVSFSHGNQIGKVNYWVNYVHRESDAWRMSHDFDPEIAYRKGKKMPDRDGIHEDGDYRENSDYYTDKFWARIGLTPSETSEYYLSFHTIQSDFGHPPATDEYRIFTRDGDEPGFSTFARFDQYDDWGIDLSGRHDFSDSLTLRGKLFYHDHTDEYVSYNEPDCEEVVADSKYKDYVAGGNLIADFSLAEWHTGHFSCHYRGDFHEAREDTYLPYNEYFSYTGSVGTEQEWSNGDGLSVFVGVSYDWFSVSEAEDYVFDGSSNLTGQEDLDEPSTKDEINPMIGFNWALGNTGIYGSIAKKIKFPTLSQLYSSQGGNPDLDAEESVNYTLGFEHEFSPCLSFKLAGFYHDIEDWISRDYYDAADTMAGFYDNMEEISMRGFETVLRYQPCDYFGLQLDYTYNDAEDESSNRVTSKVIGVPENKYGVGVDVTIPKVLARLNLRGIYVDDTYAELPTSVDPGTEAERTDDYFILNARLSTKAYRDRYSAYVEVDNILDEDYEAEIGFPGWGINYRVGFKAEF